MAATMPEFMAFADEAGKRFFLGQAGIITVVANLTDFSDKRLRIARRGRTRIA
jgi:hypothetical protein